MASQFIKDQVTLVDFCQQIASASYIAVDTEFLREKTYYPRLCLIQVATSDHIACIDPLVTDIDLTPVIDIIYHPDITAVFHAARQDLELLYLACGTLPNNIFDTQLAAALLGYGQQISYGDLVKQCLAIDLDKAHSRTDWTIRPLNTAQIHYAANDVRYLHDVYKQIVGELKQKNRLHWLDDDIATLVNEDSYQPHPDNAWRRVKGYGRLKGVELATLQRLSAWRERYAMEANRPRRWIVKDEVLLLLAKLAPDSISNLNFISGMETRTIRRHGHALLTEIKRAKSMPKDKWPILKTRQTLTQQQHALVNMLIALLRKCCDENNLPPATIATRNDIERLVMGETDLALLRGWRNEIAGRHLQTFIDSKLSVTADLTELITH